MTKRRWSQSVVLFLLGVFFAATGIYVVYRIDAAYSNFTYPPSTDILVQRSFEPDDLSTAGHGETITVTVNITNQEEVVLRGFYYSDQVPNSWVANTGKVSVNGVAVVDYAYDPGVADEVYSGFTPHRWALELPQGGGVFSPTHFIPANGGTAQIVYTVVVSGDTGSDYALGQEAWAGWLTTVPAGTAVFGYEMLAPALEANFSVAPISGEAPLTAQFSDLSTGDPTAWSWDFGDDTPLSALQHPTHTYAAPGVFTVTLTISRTEPADSDTVVRPGVVTVTRPPLQADFSGAPRFGMPPLVVTFSDLSVGDILTRTWDFGDGVGTVLLPGSALSPGPTHTYAALGYYTVTLTVEDAFGSDMLLWPRYIHVTDNIFYAHMPLILKSYEP